MNIKKFFKDSFLVTSLAIASRIIALIRDTLLLKLLATNAFADVFSHAFKIPNALRHAVAEGAINTVFLPKLKNLQEEKEVARIHALILNVWLSFSAVLMFFYFSQQFCLEAFLRIVAPGFSSEQIFIYSRLTIVTSFSAVVYLLSSILASLLQFYGYFFWPAFALALLNFSFSALMLILIYFELNLNLLVYCYFFSTILMLLSTLIPCVCYDLFEVPFKTKGLLALFIIIVFSLFIFLHLQAQFFLLSCIYTCYLYFSYKFNFMNKKTARDLMEFFYFLIPILCIGFFSQFNEIIAMRFASLFEAGSVAMLARSSKVMQIPIAFLFPFLMMLFSYLNSAKDSLHAEKNLTNLPGSTQQERGNIKGDSQSPEQITNLQGSAEQKVSTAKDLFQGLSDENFLKKTALTIVVISTFFFSLLCFLFPSFVIQSIYFFCIPEADLLKMTPLVRLYALAVPPLLLSKLLQVFFFVKKSVWTPFLISFFNTCFTYVFIRLFLHLNFCLSSIVLAFVAANCLVFIFYCVLGRKYLLA